MEPYFQEAGITIYLGNCLEVLPQIGAAEFVITDPPYNAKKNYGKGTNDARPWPEWCGWLDEVVDHCRWHAPHVFCFLSQTAYRKYIRHGRHEPAWSAIWQKPLAMAACAGPFMPHWEHIAFFGNLRGKQARWGGDVFSANVEVGKTRWDHPTPKPYLLMTKLLGRLGAKSIIDPFAGSGTTLIAAKNLGIEAVGIEIEEKHCETMAVRLSQSIMQFEAAK